MTRTGLLRSLDVASGMRDLLMEGNKISWILVRSFSHGACCRVDGEAGAFRFTQDVCRLLCAGKSELFLNGQNETLLLWMT